MCWGDDGCVCWGGGTLGFDVRYFICVRVVVVVCVLR